MSSSGAASDLGASITDLALRSFSRKQESSADEFGLGLVQQEYGHVADSWRFFERMDEIDDDFSEFLTYLSTHPAPDDRVEALIEQAGQNGWSISGEIIAIEW
jgi:predicted Zn-dependent protease